MKWVEYIQKGILAIVILIFGLLCGLTILQVFMRYVMGQSLMWGDELMRFFMVWGIFLAGGLSFYYRRHLALDYIYQVLPLKAQKILRTVIWIIILLLAIFYFVEGLDFALSNWVQLLPTLNIPRTYVLLALPVSALLWIIFGVNDLYIIWTDKDVPPLNKEEVSEEVGDF